MNSTAASLACNGNGRPIPSRAGCSRPADWVSSACSAIPLPEGFKNFWDVPNLLLQKFPAPQFTATAKVAFTARTDGEKTGLIVMGTDYAYLSVTKKPEGLVVSQTICRNADRGAAEKESAPAPVKGATLYLRVKVSDQARLPIQLQHGRNAISRPPANPSPRAPAGGLAPKWVCSRLRSGRTAENGYADFDWFRVE